MGASRPFRGYLVPSGRADVLKKADRNRRNAITKFCEAVWFDEKLRRTIKSRLYGLVDGEDFLEVEIETDSIKRPVLRSIVDEMKAAESGMLVVYDIEDLLYRKAEEASKEERKHFAGLLLDLFSSSIPVISLVRSMDGGAPLLDQVISQNDAWKPIRERYRANESTIKSCHVQLTKNLRKNAKRLSTQSQSPKNDN